MVNAGILLDVCSMEPKTGFFRDGCWSGERRPVVEARRPLANFCNGSWALSLALHEKRGVNSGPANLKIIASDPDLAAITKDVEALNDA